MGTECRDVAAGRPVAIRILMAPNSSWQSVNWRLSKSSASGWEILAVQTPPALRSTEYEQQVLFRKSVLSILHRSRMAMYICTMLRSQHNDASLCEASTLHRLPSHDQPPKYSRVPLRNHEASTYCQFSRHGLCQIQC